MFKSKKIWALLLTLSLASATSVLAQSMLATITTDVVTEFSVYQPYPVNFTPRVPNLPVPPDFSNVRNFEQLVYKLNDTDRTLLSRNHFTVKPSQYRQLYDIYNVCTWDSTPIFITTDAVLHIYHVLFDRLLAEIEMQKFVPALEVLTATLFQDTENIYQQTTQADAREVARRNLAFLGVAQKLLHGDLITLPSAVSALVDSEITLIENHDGYHFSPMLGNFSALDYSQLQPRGHYTQNETLPRYFKTMMWYGWTIFTMEPQLFGPLAERHTQQALLQVQQLYRLKADGRPLIEIWEALYQPTVFFVGKTDDPNVVTYRSIAEAIYGANFLELTLPELADATKLQAFMTRSQELPAPKIPNYIYGSMVTYKGFRLMGQRFVPDSYWFAHLVDPYVPTRYFPKGLDVMAILGGQQAFNVADTLYHETQLPNYTQQIHTFNQEFAQLPPEVWAQNLYWNWLYCLMPLLYTKGAGYPFFMQTEAWANKELLTALASWAELRHDTILYAKQSTTPKGMPPGTPPLSYVEPNPHLYARLASLARFTRTGLDTRNLGLNEFQPKLTQFESLLLFLCHVSIKELENIDLTASEYQDLFCFGKVMENLLAFIGLTPQEPGQTDDMAVVADVHTDSNAGQCLEEGVGYPLELFVLVPIAGELHLTHGAMFSYYEFTQPIAERLTDEAWRTRLTSARPPELPEWTSSFMELTGAPIEYYTYSPVNLFHHQFTGIENSEFATQPQTSRLCQNFPNPFNAQTTIRFNLANASAVKLEIYNLLGEKVRSLFQGVLPAGINTFQWLGNNTAGENVTSGLYFYRLETNTGIEIKTLVLLR